MSVKIEQREIDGFMETTYTQGVDSISIRVRRGAGSCTSTLFGECDEDGTIDEDLRWNGVVEGIQTFLLALGCSGFDMRHTNIAEAVFAMLETEANDAV